MKIKPLYMRAAAVNIKFKIRVHVVRKVWLIPACLKKYLQHNG
jgi:hypothetical protein